MLESIINWRFAARALAWGAAMLGVLQLRQLSGDWSHALCGPWGCGPTTESIVTCHAVWVLLFIPPVLVILRNLSGSAIAMCGNIAIGLGLLGLMGVGIWLGASWYPNAASAQRAYAAQKYGYTIACMVDFPMVQLVIVGALLRFMGRANGLTSSHEQTVSGAARVMDVTVADG